MSQYHPHTAQDTREMLASLGLPTLDALFAEIPQSARTGLPGEERPGLTQMETLRAMETLADRNTRYKLTLRGAGCYDHFIPPIVPQLANKKEFLSAYTPYQAELSQGVLQAIFEYQTLICELTGMDVSNAGVYDFATAAAESAAMCTDRKRSVSLVSAGAHPDTIAVMQTYAYGAGTEVQVVPLKDGRTDMDALKTMLTENVASLYIQQPNFFGQLEDVPALFAAAKEAGVKCIFGANPMTLAVLPSGAELGADIVCGDAQPFGLPMAFGGPHAGYMACTQAMMRRLPGRIAGQTTDAQGRRAFVLTLQAREQHIRREKACLQYLHQPCAQHPHRIHLYDLYGACSASPSVAESLREQGPLFCRTSSCRIKGVSPLRYPGEFFHEFMTDLPDPTGCGIGRCIKHGVLSGLPVDGGMLWCVTENRDQGNNWTRSVILVKEVMRSMLKDSFVEL